MNNAAARRRFHVVTRPKNRVRRVRMLAAFAVVLALGGVAAVTVRKVVSEFGSGSPFLTASGRDTSSPYGSVATIVEGPEPLRGLAQVAADSLPGTAGEKAERLKAKFPSIADIRVRRNWTEKTTTLTLVVRRAVAAATRGGRPAGFLADDGTVFAAPEGAFVLTGPSVEISGAGAGELSALAREWPILAADGAFPSELKGMSYDSSENGWEASLADGTKVRWGRLEWTREKLSRLAEAVADARSKEPGAFSADLRWFEDGKVLLRPVAAQMGKLR